MLIIKQKQGLQLSHIWNFRVSFRQDFWVEIVSVTCMGCGAVSGTRIADQQQVDVNPSRSHLPHLPAHFNFPPLSPRSPFRIVKIAGMSQVKEIVENKNVVDDGKNVSNNNICLRLL